jgi:putative transposase
MLLKRTWVRELRNVLALIAIGANKVVYPEVLALAEGHKEDKAGWSGFLPHLEGRGLSDARPSISDAWPASNGVPNRSCEWTC